MHTIADKPDLMPVCLGPVLCSKQQTDWWTAVYKMEKGNSRYYSIMLTFVDTKMLK